MTSTFDHDYEAGAALERCWKAYHSATDLMALKKKDECMTKLREALMHFEYYVTCKSKVPRVKVVLKITACRPEAALLMSRAYLDLATILLRFYYCFGIGEEFHKVEYIDQKIETLLQSIDKNRPFLPGDFVDEYLDFVEKFKEARELDREHKEVVEFNIKNGCHDPNLSKSLDSGDKYFEYIKNSWNKITSKAICVIDSDVSSSSSGCGCLSLILLLLFITIAFTTCASQSNQQSKPKVSQSQSPDTQLQVTSPQSQVLNTQSQITDSQASKSSSNSPDGFVVQAGEGYANLRSRPSTWESKILAKIPNGTTVKILDQETNASSQLWYKVQINGSETWVGWIYSGLLEQR